MKPVLLVGEDNPFGADPRFALYDQPVNSSGQRLRTRILGLTRHTYFGPLISRVNLCGSAWDTTVARQRAASLMSSGEYHAIVTLGRKVARAFYLSVDFFEVEAMPSVETIDSYEVVKVLSLPHPSGLSRAWNNPSTYVEARLLLADIAPHVPWGEELP